jgi:hypothetical protein
MRPHLGRLALFGQACFAGGQVRRQRFIEEVSVAGDERFTLDAEFHAAQIRQFEGELVDFDVAPVNLRGPGTRFFDQATDPFLHPRQQFWRGVKSGEFGGEVHDVLYQTDCPQGAQVAAFARLFWKKPALRLASAPARAHRNVASPQQRSATAIGPLSGQICGRRPWAK